MGDAAEHGQHGGSADVPAVLVLRGKLDGQQARILHVVDAHDANLFRHANTNGQQRLHQVSRGDVIGTDKGFRSCGDQDFLDEVTILRVAAPLQIGLWNQAVDMLASRQPDARASTVEAVPVRARKQTRRQLSRRRWAVIMKPAR